MITGGYYIKARVIKDSPVSKSPPHVRETWDYLLREAAYKSVRYGSYELTRGQLFRSYNDIREGLAWFVGYRRVMYSESDIKKAMMFLRDAKMITTARYPAGVLVTVLNYDFYQDAKNYECESTNESTSERTYESTSERTNERTGAKRANTHKQRETAHVKSNESTSERTYESTSESATESTSESATITRSKEVINKKDFSPAPGSGSEEVTLTYKVRKAFEAFYASKKPGESYYFTPTDGNHAKQLTAKLSFRLANRKPAHPVTDENVLASLDALLMNLPKWHLENLSLVNINSKFNEIVASLIKERNSKPKASTNDIGY